MLASLKHTLDRFPRLSMSIRAGIDTWRQGETNRPTGHGFTLCGNEAMATGQFEREETDLFIKKIDEFDTLVNIGANVGYYVCIAASHGRKVLAFEPLRSNSSYLMRNVKENNFEDLVTVFPIAIGEKSGLLDLYGSSTGASLLRGWAKSSGTVSQIVPVHTLDSMLSGRDLGRVLVLLDVEGAEYGVLLGARAFLSREIKTSWIVEISSTHHYADGDRPNPNFLPTFELFFSCGYKCLTADSREIEIDHSSVVEAFSSGDDLHGTHNYLFYR